MDSPFPILAGLFREDSYLTRALNEFWDAIFIHSASLERQSKELDEAAERYMAKCRRRGKKPINF